MAQPPQKKTNIALIVVIVVLLLFCCIVPVIGAVLFPVFSQARLSAQKSATLSQARRIVLALNMYATDYDDTLPPALTSNDELRAAVARYSDGDLDCKSMNPAGGVFLPNSGAAGLRISAVIEPDRAVLVYDSLPWARDEGRAVGYFSGGARYVKQFDEATMLPFKTTP